MGKRVFRLGAKNGRVEQQPNKLPEKARILYLP
jgi:hypothetical protein